MKNKHVFDLLLTLPVSVAKAAFVPVLSMVALNVTDYITGILAAKVRPKKISSSVGIKGIFKKIGMWCLVFMGFALDILVGHLGITLPFQFSVTALTAIWISVNECISILENIRDMDIKVPDFMRKIIDLLEEDIIK